MRTGAGGCAHHRGLKRFVGRHPDAVWRCVESALGRIGMRPPREQESVFVGRHPHAVLWSQGIRGQASLCRSVVSGASWAGIPMPFCGLKGFVGTASRCRAEVSRDSWVRHPYAVLECVGSAPGRIGMRPPREQKSPFVGTASLCRSVVSRDSRARHPDAVLRSQEIRGHGIPMLCGGVWGVHTGA